MKCQLCAAMLPKHYQEDPVYTICANGDATLDVCDSHFTLLQKSTVFWPTWWHYRPLFESVAVG